MTKVSVIIPTYNRLPMLEEALKSLFEQDFQGEIEAIVIDDNSSDGTQEWMRETHPEIKMITFNKNAGPYVARNHAVKESTGELIAFLDSDDLWEKAYLSTQVETIQGTERSFAVSDVVNWNTATDRKKTVQQQPDLSKYTSGSHHMLVHGSFIITPSSALFFKETFEDIGLFDEVNRMGSDTDFYVRCLLAGYQPIFTHLPYAVRRVHGSSQQTDLKNLNKRQTIRLTRLNRYFPELQNINPGLTLERLQGEVYANIASQYLRHNQVFNWLKTSAKHAKVTSLVNTLSSMSGDISWKIERVKKKLSIRNV